MNNKIILVVLALVVILGGGYLLLSNKSSTNTNQTQNTQTENATPTVDAMKDEEDAMMSEDENVTVTSTGYNPKTVTVKAGTRVVWTNKSGDTVTVNSDNHPTHQLWPFLNLGSFADGSSVSVVFEKPGTYTYHNHLDSSMTGTVVVE